jgi:hypothetical protein
MPPAAHVVAIAAGGFRSLAIETERAIIEVPEPVEPDRTEPIDVDIVEPAEADGNDVVSEIAPEPNVAAPSLSEPTDSVDANSPDAPAIAVADCDAAAVVDANAVESDLGQVVEAVQAGPVDVNIVEPADVNVPDRAVPDAVPPADANAVEPADVASEDSGAENIASAAAAGVTEVPSPKTSTSRAAGLFEGVEFYTGADAQTGLVRPVYHFTSDTLTPHFYTISKEERDRLIDEHPDIWTYEGVAFHAYPEGGQPEGAIPVYRFWSGLLNTHFYTIDENEKNAYIKDYPDLCTYQGIAWYADRPGAAAAERMTDK